MAKESPILKDAVLLSQASSKCDLHDASCMASVGKLAHCQNVLVGSSAAKGNGFVLSVRIFEVNKQRVMTGSEVEQVLETDRQSDVQAWAERAVGADGVAVHSVRAVPREALAVVAKAAEGRPVHVHLSEQPAENAACYARHGLTPRMDEAYQSELTSLPPKVA